MAEILIRTEVEAAGLAGRVSVESAGTGDWHIGERMDRRASAELARRGLDGSRHRARQIEADWLGRFDLLIAMDAANLRDLRQMTEDDPDVLVRIRMFRSFDPDAEPGAQVPDPYGGGPGEFAAVFEMMSAAARGLVEQIAAVLGEPAGD
ncbi:MAG: low molecular weight protein-tyrosine-phosphatase [Streptosporangiaceae bacterium]